ncbi:disease resistance protein RPP13-like [Solanum verrucosum]|uniref:disease resistance protein RPP13-like n=1 Tax=Solanum verrucosum TaxID=315347 RepID=UPI0020D009D3|nr:disease resistance protein RPP13-like [Solanum verrucosum]
MPKKSKNKITSCSNGYLKAVANEAVYILEEYSLDAAKDGDYAVGFIDRLKACSCICQKEAKFRNIGKDIQSLKERVMDISRKRDTYGITHINNNAGEGPSCSEEMLKFRKEMSERDLENHLRNLLKERKYLVVVDDLWHQEAWESLKRALPDNNNGSRVILTTRKENVAERVDDKGGLLSYRKGLHEWQKAKTHLWQHMKNDCVEISHILSLSYNDLSSELKQCFLYIGIFQEDHVIDAEKLMHLWLAEGFIPRIREEHMEDIAENFLHELISRSLIQVAETFFDKIFACKIHDLLRDLAVQKSMEVNLFDIYDPRVNSVTPFRLRHAIHVQTETYLSLDLSKLKVRSILFFDMAFRILDHSKMSRICCTTFPHLYVLDLENIHFSGGDLHDAIGNLVHLKFLGLCNTNLFKLPPSIGKLKCLQTLEALILDSCSCELPPQVAQLTNLRHLVARYEVPVQVNRLKNLRTLKFIRCDQWKHTDASGLVNLQELGMEQIKKSYSLKSIGSLKSLTTLFLICIYGGTFPPLEPLSSCENLHRLWLSGKIEKPANLINLPKSITVLVLQST